MTATEPNAVRVEQALRYDFLPAIRMTGPNRQVGLTTVRLAAVVAILREGEFMKRDELADILGIGPHHLTSAISTLRRAGMTIYCQHGLICVRSASLRGAA